MDTSLKLKLRPIPEQNEQVMRPFGTIPACCGDYESCFCVLGATYTEKPWSEDCLEI